MEILPPSLRLDKVRKREGTEERKGGTGTIALSLSPHILSAMLWRVRNSRGRPNNAPAAFIQPCRPVVAKRPPTGPGWAHELKHDGYRLQIHVRDGRVKLYTMTGADWSKRYPLITEAAARIGGSAILDAEVVWIGSDGVADFDALHTERMIGAR
jgi:ATP-dependent DNA ligase